MTQVDTLFDMPFIDTNHGYNLSDVTIEYYQIKANLTNGAENVVLGTEQRTFMYGSNCK